MITAAIILFVVMTLAWLISIPLKDVSIVDLIWGMAFVLVAWTHAFLTDEMTLQKGLLVACVTIWGVRLSGYLACRNIGHGEDKRYQNMRKSMQPHFWWQAYFLVFLLQGVLVWIISLPLQMTIGDANTINSWSLLLLPGLIAWSVGFVFESVGDYQLARFKSNPSNQGQVLDKGLWRYTRHPNYFGDFLQWWGLYLLAISHDQHYWTAIGPVVMSILLMKVSGVSLLEKDLSSTKSGYAEYKRRTNAFFPWFPASN